MLILIDNAALVTAPKKARPQGLVLSAFVTY
jgi:hypothetical protein